MGPTKAVLFDLDDTLVDTDGSYQTSIVRLCKELAAEHAGLTADDVRSTYIDISNTFWSSAPASAFVSRRSIRLDRWHQALLRCGLNDLTVAESAALRYETYRRESTAAFSETHLVLQRLSGQARFAVITNGAGDGQHEKLATAGLHEYFEAIFISGEVGIAKPDPAIFHLALTQLGVAPEEAVMVGDSLTIDVAGARAAGITAVWLNRDGRQPEAGDPAPDYEIASLSELPALLERPLS